MGKPSAFRTSQEVGIIVKSWNSYAVVFSDDPGCAPAKSSFVIPIQQVSLTILNVRKPVIAGPADDTANPAMFMTMVNFVVLTADRSEIER